MSHLDAVQLDELAKELEASAEGLVEQVHNTPLRSRRRGVSSNEASDSSSEEGEDGEEEGEDGEIEDENEEEQNLLLARLEKVREALQESLRRGKEEKVAKMARLQQHRLELEHLTKSLHTPQPAPPVYANDRSSPHLVRLL